MINDIEKVFDLFEEQFEDEELKSLVRECKKMYIEKERLNNIINKLEKWLKEEYEGTIFDYHNAIEDVLDKLQELKGSDKVDR